jgi:hypothetical protein
MKLQFKKSAALLLAASLLPSIASAAPKFAVWLDGNTTVPASDGILGSLNNAFGAGTWTLASDANLSTPGWLNNFDTLIMSRSGASFGVTSIPAAAAANIQTYVGAPGPAQGGVALFSNDAKDNWFGANVGDPYDVNLDRLFVNAATFAAATGHGFIGEFNGTVIALNTLGLLPGVAGPLGGNNAQFEYVVGPIGAGHPIDAGVSFPFVDGDQTPFLTKITGASNANIVDVYGPNSGGAAGFPAVLANERLINGGVPEVASTLGMLFVGLVASLGLKKRLS